MKRGICTKLFDLHCDTLFECEKHSYDLASNSCHVDLERGLAEYDAWGQVMAAFVPDTLRGDAAWAHTLRLLETARQAQVRHPDQMALVRTAADLKSAFAQHRCAVLLAVEGGAALGGDIRRIRTLAQEGVQALNLTWNGANELGNGCLSPDKAGLTPLGKQAVKTLLRYGILPDVSHLNERGFWDVATLCGNQPFLAGHSVLMSVHAHPRNLTDAQFAAVRDSGGLVGLTLCASQLGEQSMERIERHLAHALLLGGEHTLSLGFDLDGMALPPEWQGIAFARRLFEYLLKRGYAQSLLENIFFANAAGFWQKALTRKAECITIKDEEALRRSTLCNITAHETTPSM